MRPMIGHAEVPSDQLGYAGTGPEVGFVTRFQRTPLQQLNQLLPLLLGQPRWFAWMGLGGQAVEAVFLDSHLPAFHSGPRSSDEPRNFRHCSTFEQQPPRNPSLSFQL
jgi:hypothetical protein